jgi:hypothetical protein
MACVLAILAALSAAAPARAATPYLLRTDAVYRLDAAAAAVGVTITVTFTNTTPDPTGSFSSFGSVPLSLQAGASGVGARDGKGSLRVTLARQASRTVATVGLRTALRYRQTAAFTLTYRLADAANPQVRVRPSSLMLPVWGFGTTSTVTVRMPVAYTARVLAGALPSTTQQDQIVLSSGAIRDPPHWSALLVAAKPADYVAVNRRVPLTGGTVDLWVRSYADDRAWGAATLDLAARALPALQKAVGLPYAGVGPLFITESLPSGIGPLAEPVSGAQDIAVGFDATPFTVLHQLAHVWIGTDFASERWIREGLASHLAASAARQLAIAVAGRAPGVATDSDSAAIPLATWGAPGTVGTISAGTDAWAYPASWAFVDALASSIGEDRLRLVVQRVAQGVSAYDTAPGGSPASAAAPADSRQLLDQVEGVIAGPAGASAADQATSRRVEAAFRAQVWPADEGALLDQRAQARAAHQSLLAAVGDWGPPDTIRQAMETWRFQQALSLIDVARSWVSDRDRFLEAARQAGLSTPDRLVAAWHADGGGTLSRRELDAEGAFLQAYRAAGNRIDDLNPIERLGVLGGPEPRAVLASAGGLYAGGDLGGAAAAIDRAIRLDTGAQGAGVVRLAAGVAVVSVLAAGFLLGLRRLRRSFPSLARS